MRILIFIMCNILLMQCAISNPDNKGKIHDLMCHSIEDSKDLGVFLSKYDIITSDSINHLFDYAFAEKSYYYSSKNSRIIIEDSAYYIVLPIKYGELHSSFLLSDYNILYKTIDNSEDAYIVLYIKSKQLIDTVSFIVQDERIDTITLIRKE